MGGGALLDRPCMVFQKMCVLCMSSQCASRYACHMFLFVESWYIVFVCHQNDVYENSIGSVYVGGYCGLSESGLCVFDKLSFANVIGFVAVCSYVLC